MEKSKNIFDEKNQNINSMINKLSNSNEIQSYKNKIMKFIEENNNKILVSINNDKKDYLLLSRTYYLNEIDKIEKIINNEERINPNFNLTNEKYLQFLSYFNVLLSFENSYITKDDNFRSLKLQSKIIDIIKKYIINKVGKI